MSAFDRAKQIVLPVFARAHGLEMRAQGKSFGGRTCPCCGEGGENSNAVSMYVSSEGIWRWRCSRCSSRGTAIDYAAALWGITAIEAANRLAEMVPASQGQSSIPAKKDDTEALKEVLDALLHNGCSADPVVMEYLTRKRGIDEPVVREAYGRGIARMLPTDPYECHKFLIERVGEGRLKASGIWKPGSKWPAIAYRPLVFLLPSLTGAEFRLVREPGSQEPKAIRYGRLDWPWWWKGDLSTITVVEGMIDAMSLVAMGEKGCVMALPGSTSWREQWFRKCAEKYPQAKWRTGLDSDVAGNQATRAIIAVLEKAGVTCDIYAPRGAKDWNEMLLSAA